MLPTRIPALTLLLALTAIARAQQSAPTPIDRQTVVSRHNIEITKPDPMGAMAVGNGEFAFNFDITGLQSFPEFYEKTMPIGILSNWGWHSFPNPDNFTLDKYKMTEVPKGDRTFFYPSADTANPPPDAAYLRANPHRFGLARIGLEMTHPDGTKVAITDLKSISQKLNLWTGVVTSTFEVDGTPVGVITASHGTRDEVGILINSPLIATGRLKVRFAFPYASNAFGPGYEDWTKPDAHATTLTKNSDRGYLAADFGRALLDTTRYTVRTHIRAQPGITLTETAKHSFLLESVAPTIEFSAWFSPKPEANAEADTPLTVLTDSAAHWKDYWTKGGIIDFSATDDPRAAELERRIVLSQYVMAVHDAGSIPPQETGLGVNSWFGKHHMEMYWWHAAHWALWGHADLLEKSLGSLNGMIPAGQAMAKRQGARGVKWSKMTDPSGIESPSGVGPVLIWQQPHPVYLAELVYRASIKPKVLVYPSGGGAIATTDGIRGDPEILKRYQNIVFQTADYIATIVDYDPARKQYVLGPGVGTADEKHTDYAHNLNPTLELGYCKWALDIARQWRARLELAPDPLWDKVSANLAPLTVRGNVYPALELPAETSAAGMTTFLYGALPGIGIEKEPMRNTVHAASRGATGIQASVTWGTAMWAMCATRLNEPDLAIQLLSGRYEEGKNPFMPSGYTLRRPEQTPMYFPANGGWLAAIALMAAGSDANPTPTFPTNWKVRFENLQPLP